ncbi:putative protease ydgD [Candidatus Terasakiella magnetica]|nr:putative protease ydgD [Candidatus Terasakiella magnetica]
MRGAMTAASGNRIFAFLLLLALGLTASTARADKFDRELHGIKGGEDQRLRMNAKEFPWSAAGRFNNGQGGHCSGILIGPRLVATAAHCLWNKRTQRPMPASAFTFVAGFDRGEYLRASKVRALHPSPDWVFTDERQPLSSRANDWALVELDDAIGDDIGWVTLGTPKVGMAVAVAGYGKDKAFVPLAHLGCHLTQQGPPGVLFHDCDAVQGESGGPVLTWAEGQVRLVAVNVAVIPAKGELGVAASVAPMVALAARLGGSTATRRGEVSQPATLDLEGILK